MTIAVLGAGSWGTALAILLGRNGHSVELFCRDAGEADRIRSTRENSVSLPGYQLPETVTIRCCRLDDAAPDFWICAVPSGGIRDSMRHIRQESPTIFLASKGLEPASAKLLSDVVQEEIPSALVGALGGPNLAVEIVKGIPTATLCACPDETAALRVGEAITGPTFRGYYSDDLIGVELCGALKNVLAIGAGVSDGLGYGDNTKAALLARGLREMSSLGLKMGARIETFFGIAGVGDLFATANSKLSRNYRVGFAIGQGRTAEDALKEIGQVAEGVPTAACVRVLAEKYDVEMPIHLAVQAVLAKQLDPRDAVRLLMDREPRKERIGNWSD